MCSLTRTIRGSVVVEPLLNRIRIDRCGRGTRGLHELNVAAQHVVHLSLSLSLVGGIISLGRYRRSVAISSNIYRRAYVCGCCFHVFLAIFFMFDMLRYMCVWVLRLSTRVRFVFVFGFSKSTSMYFSCCYLGLGKFLFEPLNKYALQQCLPVPRFVSTTSNSSYYWSSNASTTYLNT